MHLFRFLLVLLVVFVSVDSFAALTPIGAQKEGNRARTIPAWTGGNPSA